MDINSSFPSNYIKASDLGGRTVVVTISHIDMEAVGRDKEQKPILYFEGKKKGLVLNRVNAKMVTALAGSSETNEWPGVRVALYTTMTEFGGEQVECIRIKAPVQARPAAAQPVRAVKLQPASADEGDGPDFDEGARDDTDPIPF